VRRLRVGKRRRGAHNVHVMMRVIPIRVLVIDDDDSVCRRVGTWLRELACDVVTFTGPAAALEHVARAPCHVALVDLRLADADGVATIAALRQVAPDVRIIALSAFPDVPQVLAAVRAGACDVLEKPIQEVALRDALERQLAAIGANVRSEDDFNRRLGARIRAVRTQTERTVADVAEHCGLTSSQLSQIELGKSATSTWTLARIGSALGMPLAKLMSGL
jgi:DNA-binding NtrC family response regulator